MVETQAKKPQVRMPSLSGKDIQVVPYECGFCNAGFHFRSKRERGPVCKFIYDLGRNGIVTCECDCTKTERDFRAMLTSMGKDLPTYSEPTPILPTSSLRVPVTRHVEVPDGADTGDDSADDAEPQATPNDEMKFTFGETGRVQKGQLEDAIWRVCQQALKGEIPVPAAGITPAWTAFEITLRSGTEYQPSAGAITAAFERWSKVMWVTIEEKPVLRLVAMRPDFEERGPAAMKGDTSQMLRRLVRRF